MYCVMRASVPSLYNVYRRYDTNTIIDNLAIIHVSSCNEVLALQKMSLTIIHIILLYGVWASLHVHVSTTCCILYAAYFILHVHVPTITCLLLRMCL